MNHPTELHLMMYAEEALDQDARGAEWQAIHNHVRHCAICRCKVELLRQEAQGLSSAFALADSTSIKAPQTRQFQPKKTLTKRHPRDHRSDINHRAGAVVLESAVRRDDFQLYRLGCVDLGTQCLHGGQSSFSIFANGRTRYVQ